MLSYAIKRIKLKLTRENAFDVSNVTGIASKWKRWRRAFEHIATGKGIEDAAQAKALLRHTAAENVLIVQRLESIGT